MTDERVIEAKKALSRYEDRNSKPNPAHLADAVRGLLGLLEDLTEPDAEPCTAETWSWDIFRPEQVDAYWMRCHQVGKHDRHENSETGATWPVTSGENREEQNR